MSKKIPFEELIKKIYRGKASVAEVRGFFRKLRTDKDLDERIIPEHLQDAIGTGHSITENQLEYIWSKVEYETNLTRHRKSVYTLPVIFRVAAVLAILIIAGFVGVKVYESTTWTTYVTLSGEVRNIDLEDGTSVVLNGNSVLKVHKNLSADKVRDVYLTGEANFQVTTAQNEEARFVVHTRDLDVEVLGTRFNVNSRERATSVYLEEGSVKIKQDKTVDQEVFMSPGEKIEYSVLERKLEFFEVQSEINEISWREGIFEFEELSLDNILRQITEPHDYTFQIDNPKLGDRRFTLRIPDNDLEFAISVLEKLTGTSIVDNEGQLIVQERDKALVEPSK